MQARLVGQWRCCGVLGLTYPSDIHGWLMLGYYSPTHGLAACEPCPSGFFAPDTNMRQCVPCQAGRTAVQGRQRFHCSLQFQRLSLSRLIGAMCVQVLRSVRCVPKVGGALFISCEVHGHNNTYIVPDAQGTLLPSPSCLAVTLAKAAPMQMQRVKYSVKHVYLGALPEKVGEPPQCLALCSSMPSYTSLLPLRAV